MPPFLLTMRSVVVVGLSWSRTCSWSTGSCSRRHVGHGLLLHPWHGPLSLHGHLQVVGQRLAARQHLVGHDLSPELVQLVLIKGSGATCSPRADPCAARTLRTSTVRRAHSLGGVTAALHRASTGARWSSWHHGPGGGAVSWDGAWCVFRASQGRRVAWGSQHRFWVLMDGLSSIVTARKLNNDEFDSNDDLK